MGKKRPRSDHNSPSPSDIISCSSGMELLSEKVSCSQIINHTKPLHSVDSGKQLKPMSSVLDTSGSSLKLLHAHPSAAQHHQSLGRSSFFNRSRYYYAHKYSRRNLSNVASASTSCGKGTSSRDEKLSYKLAPQGSSDSGRHSARIRSSYLVVDAASTDPMKMLCGICQKPLKRKPFYLGSTLSSTEVSVVAVLVCGHVYHADCLEQKTDFEDRRDPPCPFCIGLLPKIEDSIVQVS